MRSVDLNANQDVDALWTYCHCLQVTIDAAATFSGVVPEVLHPSVKITTAYSGHSSTLRSQLAALSIDLFWISMACHFAQRPASWCDASP